MGSLCSKEDDIDSGVNQSKQNLLDVSVQPTEQSRGTKDLMKNQIENGEVPQDREPSRIKQQYQGEQQQQSLVDLQISIQNYTTILKEKALVMREILKDPQNVINNKNYYYASTMAQKSTDTRIQMTRLNNELKQLGKQLPVYSTNSAFVCADTSRADVMKGLIMGSEDTPYDSGVFLFDIYFDDSYPTQPPQVNLMTTGNGQIRFNPNLYNNGYVCLSLLGTWRGDPTENWSPANSNLTQILQSVQSLVMNNDVYFNEPGLQSSQKTTRGQGLNMGYSNIVRYGTVQYAMNENINNPPPEFREVILVHFYLQKQKIIQSVQQWIDSSPNDHSQANYQELVMSHNFEIAQLMVSKGYPQLLQEEFEILKSNLLKITQEDVQKILASWETHQ